MYTVADYDFDGPYTQLYEIVDQRGVFVVLSSYGGEWRVLDVDCAEYVRSAIERHPRMQKWKDACYHGGLSYAVYYSGVRSDAEMEQVVDEIDRHAQPRCRAH